MEVFKNLPGKIFGKWSCQTMGVRNLQSGSRVVKDVTE
jgi:hypothetical protein